MPPTRFACVIADILYILFSLKFSMFLDGIRPPRIAPAARGMAPPFVGNLRCQRKPFTSIIACLAHRIKPDFDTECIRDGFLWKGSPYPVAIPPTGADLHKARRLLLSQPTVSHAVSSFARVRAKRRSPVLPRPAERLTAFPHPAIAMCNAGSGSRRLQFPSCNTGTSSSLPRRAPPLFYGPRRPTCSFP